MSEKKQHSVVGVEDVLTATNALTAMLQAFKSKNRKLPDIRTIVNMAQDQFAPLIERAESGWLPIETAPKDQRIDILAKIWAAHSDKFSYSRFPHCRWYKSDGLSTRDPHWDGVHESYRAVFWRPIPEPPEALR